jgi:hypothetical protein
MTRRMRRRFALLAVALVFTAQGGALAADPLRLTKPVNATTGDESPDRTYSGPFVLVDPSNSRNVVASYVNFRTRRCGLMRSTDAGQTWKQLDQTPALPTYPFCLVNNSNVFHGPMAFGRNGTLYYTLSGWDVEDREVSRLNAPGNAVSNRLGNFSVLLGRSTDLGDTWETTLVRNSRGLQGEAIEDNRPVMGVAVDAKSGKDDIVYVTYQASYPARVAPDAAPNLPMVAVSTDGGRSFGEPVNVAADAFKPDAIRAEGIRVAPTGTTIPPPNVSTTTTTAPPQGSRAADPNRLENWGGRNPHMTLDAKGNVYVIWHSSTANITPAPPTGHFLSKSTDRGRTWQTTQVAPFDRKNGLASRLAWSPEGGDNGTLHWVHQRAEDPDIASYSNVYYRQSTDGGRTWSEPRILPDEDPKNLNGKYIPNISVAPNGRLDVSWWDTRDDPGTRSNDVYYTYSENNGKTWAKNVRITDQSINRQYGVWGVNFDQSTPVGMASTNAYTVFAWDDTRNTDPNFADNRTVGGGVQDVFTANAQFKAIGGGTPRTAKIVLAAVVGLLTVGLVLLAVALGSKSRARASATGDRPEVQTAPAREGSVR